ncbi:class I SAM-dependent methyltransferase [Pseudonocardia nigra]|uniref:class I SAM-dependent methyltransferase n=1 Tax=Pseudonocardia nigra TaxID=1921578 RepID=UPI001C5F1BC6|nr:methyltransferase domain-containing protein [Pseudonocardia nigra]
MGSPTTPAPDDPQHRPPADDPRLDLVAGSVELRHGRLEFVRPREATALLYEEDVAADQAYPPYWAEVWPSGVELAYAVSAREWAGASVLELGCGLGLPAVAAALGGGEVLATDRSPDALAFAAVNAERNGVAIGTAVCSWAEPAPVTEAAPWRLVLAADVLYGQRNIAELLALLPRLVDDGGEVWIADPQRPLAGEFLAAARRDWDTVTTAATRDDGVRLHRLAAPRTNLR